MAGTLGLKDPKLTRAQSGTRQAKLVSTTAAAVGIIIGCILGMFPLLFKEKNKEDEETPGSGNLGIYAERV